MQGQARLAAGPTEGGATPFGRSHSLDVLRGLAIVGVMAIQVSQSFPSNIHTVDYAFMCGWAGVNVFYFVSAMTMCLMWTRAHRGEPNSQILYPPLPAHRAAVLACDPDLSGHQRHRTELRRAQWHRAASGDPDRDVSARLLAGQHQ